MGNEYFAITEDIAEKYNSGGHIFDYECTFRLNMDSFNKIKRYLVSKQKETVDKLRSLDQEESLLSQATPEAWELGTYSWEADVNSTKLAIKRQLGVFLDKIETSLSKLIQGTYGKCERCLRQIDQDRLKIIPTASFCMSCQDGSFKGKKPLPFDSLHSLRASI